MPYDAIVIAPHPDDAETQMGGTLAKLADRGQRILVVDLTDGEPTEFARARRSRGAGRRGRAHPRGRSGQPGRAGSLPGRHDRPPAGGRQPDPIAPPALGLRYRGRLRPSRPCRGGWPDARGGLPGPARPMGAGARAPSGWPEQEPWAVERLFFPHCKMEPPWTEFAFAVDVSAVYERKRRALAAYRSIFRETGRSPARPLRGGGSVLRSHARRRLRRNLSQRLAAARSRPDRVRPRSPGLRSAPSLLQPVTQLSHRRLDIGHRVTRAVLYSTSVGKVGLRNLLPRPSKQEVASRTRALFRAPHA